MSTLCRLHCSPGFAAAIKNAGDGHSLIYPYAMSTYSLATTQMAVGMFRQEARQVSLRVKVVQAMIHLWSGLD